MGTLNSDQLTTIQNDLNATINVIRNVPVFGNFLVGSSTDISNSVATAENNPTANNILNAAATIGKHSLESFVGGVLLGGTASLSVTGLAGIAASLGSTTTALTQGSAISGISSGIGSSLVTKIVMGGIISTTISAVIAAPVSELMGQVVPTKLLSPMLLARGYANGSISYDQLINDPSFKVLEPSDQQIVLTYGNTALAANADKKQAAAIKAWTSEQAKLIGQLDAINKQQFDELIAEFTSELNKLQNEHTALMREENTSSQSDILQYYNKLAVPVETAIAKSAAAAANVDPYISTITYDDFYNIALDVAQEFVLTQVNGGINPTTDQVLANVDLGLQASTAITQAQLDYAVQQGYLDKFKSSLTSILNSVMSSTGAT